MNLQFKARILFGLIASFSLTFQAARADDQTSTYPDRPVTFVVGFSPGSSIDLVARVFGKSLSTTLQQPVVVENKSGAAGNIAAESVATAKPDGYRLLVIANSIAIGPAIYKDLRFNAKKDLAAIAYIGKGPVILKVRKSLHIDNLKELIAYAKAHPGKLNYGSSGIGGTPHMATVLFEQVAGIKLTHIPYKGGAEALSALMSGQVDLLINPLLSDVGSDKVVSIAITGDKRSSLAPTVPTFTELGFPNYDLGVYYGLMSPKAVPDKIKDILNASVNNALDDKDVVETLTDRSGIVLQKMSRQEFQDYLDHDTKLWKDVVAKTNIAPR